MWIFRSSVNHAIYGRRKYILTPVSYTQSVHDISGVIFIMSHARSQLIQKEVGVAALEIFLAASVGVSPQNPMFWDNPSTTCVCHIRRTFKLLPPPSLQRMSVYSRVDFEFVIGPAHPTPPTDQRLIQIWNVQEKPSFWTPRNFWKTLRTCFPARERSDFKLVFIIPLPSPSQTIEALSKGELDN